MPPIPASAKTTDLAPVANAARQHGFLSRLSTAVRYAIAGVTPDTWMSPNQPVTPVAPGAAGRQFDYPVGVNLTYTPRVTELTSFGQLRALADRCDLVRLAIETRKDQMASMVWSVTGLDDSKEIANDPREKAITALLKRPDGVHSWQSWLRMLMEEVMVTDAPSLYVRRRNNGELFGFELIDGTTIKPLVDDGGRRPLPPSPAYQQVLKGIPAVDYTSDELVYTPRNPRVHKFYGFSPVEQIILTVNIALRRMASQLQYFTEGNMPAAYASLPADWSGEQIKQFQAYWDSVIEGDQGYKRKVRFVPAGTKVESVKDAPLKDEFDEWLARVVCYAFSLPPTAFVKQQNRSTSETQQEAALKEGLAPLMVWVKEVMDHLIQVHMGCPDLQFRWIEEESLDPGVQATILTTYQKQGAYTINEIRAKLGEDPISEPGGDAYLIFTATGAVPLEQVMAPPPPPVAPVDPSNPDQPPKGGKPAPEPDDKAEKHAHGDLHKAAEPLTNAEMALRDAFAAALDVVKQDAIKALKKLGKTAADGTRGGDNGTSKDDVWLAEYISELDTSGLALAWDDYSDTLVATTADGAKHQVARLIVTDPDITSTSPEAVAAIFGGKDPDAVKWATEHAAEMLSSDGTGGKLAEATREMVRETLAKALADDASHTGLADLLETAYAFSPDRAALIATTEMRDAQGKGAYIGATAVGMKAKRWLLSNDEGICVACQRNAKQEWIPIDQPFQSGDVAPLAHPRCRCDAAYKRKLPEN
jgi:HK97 family phage portal protein